MNLADRSIEQLQGVHVTMPEHVHSSPEQLIGQECMPLDTENVKKDQ